MKRFNLLLLSVLISISVAAKKVHTIGDSTMQTYDPAKTSVVGWGQVLQQFFHADSVEVNNKAVSGTSSKSFYQTYWPKMINDIEPGDVVIIQFAHNDEKSSGEDGDSLYVYYLSIGDSAKAAAQERRGTSPYNTFRKQLRIFVNEAKARGAKPIIVSSICRATLGSDGHVTRSGRHDIGGSSCLQIQRDTLVTLPRFTVSDRTMDYAWNAYLTAQEYDDVPFLDLTTPTDSLWSTLGADYCTEKIFPVGDKTHPMELGSTLVAQLFIDALRSAANGAESNPKKRAVLEDLADDLRAFEGLQWAEQTIVFDTVYSGTPVSKSTRLTGFRLGSAQDTVRIFTRHGFEISTDNEHFAQSLSIPYEQATLLQNIQVRMQPRANDPELILFRDTVFAVLHADTIPLPILLPVRAIPAEEGLPFTMCYPLGTDQHGEVNGVGYTPGLNLVGLKHYKFYDVASGSPMWYLIRPNTGQKGRWPGGETDTCGSRYIELIYEAPQNALLQIDTLHLNLSMTSTGNLMCAKVYYSTQADFSDAQYACGYYHLTSWRDHKIGASMHTTLQPGQRLYVRVYPWLDVAEETPDRWFCISQVTISGRAYEAIEQLAYGVKIGDYWYNFDPIRHTAKLTYRGETYQSYAREYSGAISIPDSVTFRDEQYAVTTIGAFTFTGCNTITSIRLPATIHTIEELAMYATGSITSLIVAPANPTFDSRNHCNAIIETRTNTLVQGCLTTVIPDDVTTLGKSCFNSFGITQMDIPASVQTIRSYAFFSTKMKKVYIPANVQLIESLAFSTRYLDSIVVDTANTVYDSRNHCNAIIKTSNNTLIAGSNSTYIPDGITAINGYAFYRYTDRLNKLRLPASLQRISPHSIVGCVSLDTLDCYLPEPISIDSTSIIGNSPTMVIVVNPGTKELWEAAPWWSLYPIVERAQESTENPSTDPNEGTDTPTESEVIEYPYTPHKLLIGNHLYIQSNGTLYTPTGQRVR